MLVTVCFALRSRSHCWYKGYHELGNGLSLQMLLADSPMSEFRVQNSDRLIPPQLSSEFRQPFCIIFDA
ncbi:hypothetical protein SLA2020_405780 [Shorea laevis]